MEKRRKNGLKRLIGQYFSVCLTMFLLSISALAESTDPILISEAKSIRALAVDANKWDGKLPAENTEAFYPGDDSRVVIFVTNVNFIEGEGADSLRVHAEDRTGKIYRLTVEDVRPLDDRYWVHGVTVRLYDENGLNGQPGANGDVLLRLTWRGMTSNRVTFGLGTADGGMKGDKRAVPTPAPEAPLAAADFAYNTDGDRLRFMQQAAFGPNAALELRLRRIGAERWINEQFSKQPTFPYPNIPLKADNPDDMTNGCPPSAGNPNPDYVRDLCRRTHYSQYEMQRWMFNEALYGEDQLRRRVSWALHQIWVTGGNAFENGQARWHLEYVKILDRHAFGNYRQLMSEMTFNPYMGNYLDMVRSTRRNPNENYPREILQLFSIGLDELNTNGTPKISNGNRIPTYDQEKIVQFTKVFTGWQRCESGPPACPNDIPNGGNYIDPMILNVNVGTPSVTNPGNHDISAKSLFNYPGAPNPTIPACTNCTDGPTGAQDVIDIRNYATDSINKTLDNIYNHPNTAPFVSKLLIQHLVTSDPSPAYVARVANVFNANRTSPTQMQAVIKAILLDVEARGSRKTAPDYGKLREPFQLATNFLRQFKVRASGSITVNSVVQNAPAACQNRSDGFINPETSRLSQNVWNPPSVFNYFSPEYIIPGTDIVGPEFNIMHAGTAFRRINFINTMVYGQINFEFVSGTNNPNPNTPCGTSIDLTEVQNLAAADPTGTQMIEWLNREMLGGQMSAAFKQRLRTAVEAIPVAQANSARDRARQAVYLVATSSQYQVQR